MSLQTIFVTNRNVNRGKDAKKHLFGNDLAKPAQLSFASATAWDKQIIRKRKLSNKITRTYKSVKKTYQLALLNEAQRTDYLQDIIANPGNDRPWLVFLHGNNQTLSKNLMKSRQIQDEYQVNIVIFSWPSKSYEPQTMPALVLTALLAANPSTVALAKWTGKKAFQKKVKQYRVARKVAEKTAPQFSQALAIIRDELLLPLRQQHNPHTCLLVHSLGHHVLRTVVETDHAIDPEYEFNTCLLHQADEEDQNHQTWAAKMSMVRTNSTYVTRNKFDSVLLLSGIVNNDFDLRQALTRLGNRSNRDSQQGSPLNYIEFSGLDDVGIGHGIAWDDGRSPEVDALCRPVLTGADI